MIFSNNKNLNHLIDSVGNPADIGSGFSDFGQQSGFGSNTFNSGGGGSNLSFNSDPSMFAPGPSSLSPTGELQGLSFFDRFGAELSGINAGIDPITKNILRAAGILIPGASTLTSGMIGLTALAKTFGISVGNVTQAEIDSAFSSGKISDSDRQEFSSTLNQVNQQGGFQQLEQIGGDLSGNNQLSNNPLLRSAQENIALQKEQLARIEGITAPFRAAGTDVALPSLSNLAFGGDVDFQPSKLFGQQLGQGREDILQGQAAGGGVKSSQTFDRFSNLVSGLASEDVGRFEQGNVDLLNTGLRAENLLRQAGTSTAGTVGNIFGNLGSGLNQAEILKGQADLAKSQTIAGGVRGLGDLFLTLGE